MIRIIFGFILILSGFLFAHPVSADYVLPYPSYMPGNKLYRISRMLDSVRKPLYFGSIATLKYHLSLSDKYLVEAKTLFEYKQYLLAADALRRSDDHFRMLSSYVARGEREGKDMSRFRSLLTDASLEHQRILTGLMPLVPPKFSWQPEKAAATELELHMLLVQSGFVRGDVRREVSP